MTTHLFRNFLTDPAEYQQAKEYWQSVSDAAIPQDRQALWLPWAQEFKDDEAATIFSRINSDDNKAFLIVQMDVKSDVPVVEARMDQFGAHYYEKPIDNLYISCELSVEAAELVLKLVRAWIDPLMDSDRMMIVIDEILREIK